MYPQLNHEEALAWAKQTVDAMTLEEKCLMIGGVDVFFTQAISRLGIPKVMFSDATAGVVLRDRFFDTTYQNAIPESTAFPAPIMLAATWHTDLAEQYATSIAQQCRANGVGVLLGPGFNLYRISQCGRNFEYFGEDPFLISSMVERYVQGVQNQGVIATLKHFVANNTDFFRRKSNSVVDSRTLHEIYLPAFEAGIAAGAMAVMTSYNLVNGEWAGQSKAVINDLLREELGFEWLVMTDWWSVFDGDKVLASGQDLEMPAADAVSDVLDKIQNGKADEVQLDRMVTSILKTFKAMGSYDIKPQPELLEANIQTHRAVALQTAREGAVLLRNQNNTLPLTQPPTQILLLGDYINKKAAGGGSSFVRSQINTTQYEALAETYGADKLKYMAAPTDEDIKNAELIILSIGTQDAESWDRPFALHIGEEAYIERIVALNQNVIVLVNSGSGIRMTDWHEQCAAILYCWYNGEDGNRAIAEIISGKVNPSGKLPITIEKDFADSPGADYVPDGETLYQGEQDPWEAAREIYDVEYNEGVFVGYRWYESKNIEPLYPFGFGLSYTDFAYKNLDIDSELLAGESLSVEFEIENTGEVQGAEIAQIYVRDLECSVPRPDRELKGFAKIELKPGESKALKLELPPKAFAFWAEEQNDWCIEAGEFEILLGSSSQDIRLRATVTIR